jgi:hypothetical protein
MEKWKTESRFPTFPPPRIYIELKNKKTGPRAGFALRPAAALRAAQESKGNCRSSGEIVVVNAKK